MVRKIGQKEGKEREEGSQEKGIVLGGGSQSWNALHSLLYYLTLSLLINPSF